jgi:hypothetical protein
MMGKQSLANLMLYTPPPMLSPMRSGSGLYRSISRQGRFEFKVKSLLDNNKLLVLQKISTPQAVIPALKCF